MNKLLYIYPVGLEGADMEQRAGMARELGFDVLSLPNERFIDPVIEEELAAFVAQPDCVGVWADVEAEQLDGPAARLVVLAGISEKRLLGRQRMGESIVRNFIAIIGLPEDHENPQLGINDDELDDTFQAVTGGVIDDSEEWQKHEEGEA